MIKSCNKDGLIRLVRGDLGEAAAAEIRSHADDCVDCVLDLCWLVAQKERYGVSVLPAPSLSALLWRRIARALSLAEIRGPGCAAQS